jgi:hypothetical protein
MTQSIWSHGMRIDRSIFTSRTALRAAKIILREQRIPAELVEAVTNAMIIVDAVNAGWFIIPTGKNGMYTKPQFAVFGRHLCAHPDIPYARSISDSFMSRLPELWAAPLFELFGSTSSRRLRNPNDEARRLSQRCPRMPFSFTAGKCSADTYCDLLDDISNNCIALVQYVELLGRPGMLDSNHCLRSKTAILKTAGCLSLLPAVVNCVHRIHMGRDGERELSNVIYRGKQIESFLAYIYDRDEERRLANEATWRANFRTVADVASVLAEARSFHQSTITKDLRSQLGPRLGIVRIDVTLESKYVLETGTSLRLGEWANNTSVFELSNWVLSLDLHLKNEEPSIYGYLTAASKADAAIEGMRQQQALSA